jgi:hypothetical protein
MSSLVMVMEIVSETLVSFNHLMWLLAQEDFQLQ